jgi:hypothetical protein
MFQPIIVFILVIIGVPVDLVIMASFGNFWWCRLGGLINLRWDILFLCVNAAEASLFKTSVPADYT